MINITQYFNENEDVYVRNKTRPLGIVSLSLGAKEDRSYPMLKSSVPINLTNSVPKKEIVESSSFRQMVQKGIIELLSKTEFERITNNLDMVKIEREQRRILEKNSYEALPSKANVKELAEFEEDEPILNSRVVQLMHVMSLDDLGEMEGAKPSENAAIDELETLSLTDDDLAYISTHARGKIKKWVQAKFYPIREEATIERIPIKPSTKRGRKKKEVTSDEAA